MTDATYNKLKIRFPQVVQDHQIFRDESTITVDAAHIVEIVKFLRDDPSLAYNMLMDIYGLDRSELRQTPRFASVYELYSFSNNQHLRLVAPLQDVSKKNGHVNGTASDDNLPGLDSITSLWAGANWMERETYDLMGIRYHNHPWLMRIMMPFDWVGHPLRKDYPLGGEPVTFSHDKNNPRFASHGQQIMAVPSYHSEIEEEVDVEGNLVINMGPHHPSTHGVLRLAVELDGERVVSVNPEIGYLHSGFEKTGENKRYEKFIPYCDRMDYLSAMCNNLAYILTVEKLLDVEVPKHAQYARVLINELQRLASHLMWLGIHAMDVSGTAHGLIMYCFYWREKILDIFEMVCGARLTTSYFCAGGLRFPLPPAFHSAVQQIVDELPGKIKEFEGMLTNNPIWHTRLDGIGYVTKEQALDYCLSGPMLRGSGVDLDMRKAKPYSSYEEFDFDVPLTDAGDCYGRYLIRLEEMRQSIRIIEQGLYKIQKEKGPHKTDDRKVALPPRKEISESMESLIHHFKLVTEGFRPPKGQVYGMYENPKGILAFGLVSDGSATPQRLRVRGPSFVNLQATDLMARGNLLADLVTVIGSIDIVLGEVDR